jgi:hypothetical protein
MEFILSFWFEFIKLIRLLTILFIIYLVNKIFQFKTSKLKLTKNINIIKWFAELEEFFKNENITEINEKLDILNKKIDNSILKLFYQNSYESKKEAIVDLFTKKNDLEIPITIEGAKIKTPYINISIAVNTVETKTIFKILHNPVGLKYPLDVNKISPVFELMPHSVKFNKHVTLEFNYFEEDSCLFILENNNESKNLNEWTICYPNRFLSDSIQFDVINFSYMFLGKMNNGLDIKYIQQIENDLFKKKFHSYQYIKPGLNYRIVCENNYCNNREKFIIINRGYGKFKPNDDIDEKQIICPVCLNNLDEYESIRLIILFQSKGTIDYREQQSRMKQTSFDVASNTLKLYGDDTSLEKYKNIIINVNKSDEFISDEIAGIERLEEFFIRNNLPDNYIMPSDVFIARLNNHGMGIPHISLAWENENDLDLHVIDPNGEEIYYAHTKSQSGGLLDVDANAGEPFTKEPIENIFWSVDINAPKGIYKIYVNYFAKHCNSNVNKFKVSILTKFNKRIEFNQECNILKVPKLVYEFKLD